MSLPNETRISRQFTVRDWRNLREGFGLSSACCSDETKRRAFEIFRDRLETRFLRPIHSISEIGKREGEGFSVMALLCVLVELLEASWQGKIYVPHGRELKKKIRVLLQGCDLEHEDYLQPFEYRSSRGMFEDFLTTHSPFNKQFTKHDAFRFYCDIRCGLLHEAATKGTSTINFSRNPSETNLFIRKEGGLRIYWEQFRKGIDEFIQEFENQVLNSQERLQALFRKLDDISGIHRDFVFMAPEQFEIFAQGKINRFQTFHDVQIHFPATGESQEGECVEIAQEDIPALQKQKIFGGNHRLGCVTIGRNQPKAVARFFADRSKPRG